MPAINNEQWFIDVRANLALPIEEKNKKALNRIHEIHTKGENTKFGNILDDIRRSYDNMKETKSQDKRFIDACTCGFTSHCLNVMEDERYEKPTTTK